MIGAGAAGLSAAHHICRDTKSIIVIDHSKHCGGFHKDRRIGPYSFDLGSIFYEVNSRLLDLAPGLRDLCLPVQRVQKRIEQSNRIAKYPFETREIRSWPVKHQLATLRDAFVTRHLSKPNGALDTLCVNRLGSTLFRETGLQDYVKRLNHLDPGEMDETFFYRRMGQIDRATRGSVWSKLRQARKLGRKLPAAKPKMLVRPPEGFSAIFEKIQMHLERNGVTFRLGEAIHAISRENGVFLVDTDAGQIKAKSVISSAPVETIYRLLFGRPTDLESLDLTTLFVSAERLDDRLGNVFYNFTRHGAWKRGTVYSKFYPDLGEGRSFFSVERTSLVHETVEPEDAFAEFAAQLQKLGLANDLKLEGSAFTRNCYPLYRTGFLDRVNQITRDIEEAGITLVGRQGRFEYLPTSSLVIKQVISTLSQTANPVSR